MGPLTREILAGEDVELIHACIPGHRRDNPL